MENIILPVLNTENGISVDGRKPQFRRPYGWYFHLIEINADSQTICVSGVSELEESKTIVRSFERGANKISRFLEGDLDCRDLCGFFSENIQDALGEFKPLDALDVMHAAM